MKNRTFKLVYQSSYLALGFIALLASFGLFQYNFRQDFYVYFTNLSNYLCIAVMVAEFIETVRHTDNRYTSVLPKLKFASVLAIMTTFFVYNFVLVPAQNITRVSQFEISSFLFHMVLPLMFTADWFLFYERKKVKWLYPLFALLVPFVYGIYIYVRAAVYGFNADKTLLYPYFFMNIRTMGVTNVVKWLSVMLVVYVACGYVLLLVDRIIPKNINKNRKGETK